MNLSPLYRGQVLVHGLGFSPDRKTIAVVSIASNSVSFIDTATNRVKHVTYVGRSPHEAFFTQDGSEVWVTVRGEDYVAVLDGTNYAEKMRIKVPNGPGMTIFSPDGRYGYVCSSFIPETVVVSTQTHEIVGRVKQVSPFCPNIAASPDGEQVWLTLKDVGKVMVFAAKPPFNVIRVMDTGPITNHVNFVQTPRGQFAYVTIGGLNQVKAFRTSDFEQVATIAVGDLPHGIWPSGDGTRVYVGIENGDAVAAIDTSTNRVIANIPNGQAAQALVYVPEAAPTETAGIENLQPLGLAGSAVHLALAAPGSSHFTTVALFDQGLTQVLQAAVAGLEPAKPYLLALASNPDGSGQIEPIAQFMTNPAGAAVVNAVGPIRQIVAARCTKPRRAQVPDRGDQRRRPTRPTGSAAAIRDLHVGRSIASEQTQGRRSVTSIAQEFNDAHAHQDPRCGLLDHAGILRDAFAAAYGVCAGRGGGRRKGLRPLRPLPLEQAG